jgi:mRNA interferase RelE/StbE
VYSVKLKPRAIKDLQELPATEANKVVKILTKLEQGVFGDIKKLTNFTPEYRMKVGNYRVLFKIEEKEIIIYQIKHR